MKFVFIVDTSPMMLLKHHDISNDKNVTGMTFFQESVYAIEEFVNHRKRLNEFKTDKYYLIKTMSKGEQSIDNSILSSCEHPYRHF